MAIFHGSKVKIFSLSSNLQLAQEIADYVGIPLTECEVMRFAGPRMMLRHPWLSIVHLWKERFHKTPRRRSGRTSA